MHANFLRDVIFGKIVVSEIFILKILFYCCKKLIESVRDYRAGCINCHI